MAVYDKPSPPSPIIASTCTLLVELLQKMIDGDKATAMECLALAGSNKQTPTPASSSPKTLEYTSTQLESAGMNLEVFAKHVWKYMVEQGKWEDCTQQKSTSVAKSVAFGVPVI